MRPLALDNGPDVGKIRKRSFYSFFHADQVQAEPGFDWPLPFTQRQKIQAGGEIRSEVTINNTARCCIKEGWKDPRISGNFISGFERGKL